MTTLRITTGARRLRSGIALVALLLVASQLPGCGEDEDGRIALNPPPQGVEPTTPEGLAWTMAEDLFSVVVHHELDTLFQSPSIDYQKLMTNFLDATKQLLDQNTITTQMGYVNGAMKNLNSKNTRFLATDPTDPIAINDVYDDIIAEEGDVDLMLGVLEEEEYKLQSLAGWMSGAQVRLSFLGLEIQLNAIRDPSNRAVQTDLAVELDEFINYAVDTRSQILYPHVIAAGPPSCQEYDVVLSCGTGCVNTVHYWRFTDCDGHVHDLYESSSSCASAAKSASVLVPCAEKAYTPQAQSLSWIDDILSTWRDTLAGMADEIADVSKPCALCADANAVITVDYMSTSFGGGAFDTTVWPQAACNGRQVCDYRLDAADFHQSAAITDVEINYHCGNEATEHTVSISGAGNPQLSNGAYVRLDCAPRVTNMQATFRGQAVSVTGADIDVSTHSQPGPAAGAINDKVQAPAGTAWNDPRAIILPNTGFASGVTIDLGSLRGLCGSKTASCYDGPLLQADSHDVYRLAYSADGVTWHTWFDFPTSTKGGLQFFDTLDGTGPPAGTPNVNARYVRVYPDSGDGKYSVAELTFYSTTNAAVSQGRPAWGPEPLVTNGDYAPEGTVWNSPSYAIDLSNQPHSTGPGLAHVVDLGQFHSLNRVKVQADYNDVYQIDVSADGNAWHAMYTAPTLSGAGLRTRDSQLLIVALNARYVRVRPTSGDGAYSVSEVQLFTDTGLPPCDGKRYCGISVSGAIEGLAGGPPSAQDLQDFLVSWACGDDPTVHTTHAVPWNGSYPWYDLGVAMLACARAPTACVSNQVTTCSIFGRPASDDIVYQNVKNLGTVPLLYADFDNGCISTIQGKTNYYHQDPASPSTHGKPACDNVIAAIHDSITGGVCPPGIDADSHPPGVNADASNSYKVWPYNVSIGSGSTTTYLEDPANRDPKLPLLPFVGCTPIVP